MVHEVAHQWWYGLVGSDQYVHAFMDEAMANYVSIVHFEQYGPDVVEQQAALNLKLPYLAMLFTEGDQVVDYPTDAFPNGGAYGTTIYAKGALGMQAIHDEIGDEAFFAALAAYTAQERFEVALPEDLKAAFEQAWKRPHRSLAPLVRGGGGRPGLLGAGLPRLARRGSGSNLESANQWH